MVCIRFGVRLKLWKWVLFFCGLIMKFFSF